MGFKKKLALITATMAMVISTGSTAFAADFPGVAGGGNTNPGTGCSSTDGTDGTQYDGNFPGIDATSDIVHAEFWIRGVNGSADSAEYETVLAGGVFTNSYQPLVVKIWRYPSSVCTPEQVMQLVNNHVAARQATPGVNNAGYVEWASDPELMQLFVATTGNMTETNVFTSAGTPSGGQSTSLVTTDAASVLADANNDHRNPFEDEGACMTLGPRSFGLDTEASTSGSGLIIGYYDPNEGRNRVTMLPNGSFALGGPKYTEDESTDILGNSQNQPLDVHCSFQEMLVEVDKFLAEYGLDASALIGWKQTGMFTRKDRPGSSRYYGIGNAVANPNSCQILEEGLLQKKKFVGNDSDFWQIDGWNPSGATDIGNAEVSTVIDPGMRFERQPGVKGWYRRYSSSVCRRAQVLSEMRGSVADRINRGENVIGWVNDWNASRFEMHPDVGGGWAINPFPSWLKRVR